MDLVQIYLIKKLHLLPISLHFFSCYFYIFPSWIRIRICNGDPDPEGKMNADPYPQPCFYFLLGLVPYKFKFKPVLRIRIFQFRIHRMNLYIF